MTKVEEIRKAIEFIKKHPEDFRPWWMKTCLSLAESVLSCEGWPEKKMGEPERSEFTGNCDDDYDSGYDRGSFFGFNEAIDLCLAAHAKAMLAKDKEIAELKAKLEGQR